MADTTSPLSGAPTPQARPEAVAKGSLPGSKGLRTGALGLVSSVAMGLASTAPAYSLAATLGLVVAGVGVQAPIVIVLAFVPMLLIAYAYKSLNAADPDCGTTFVWAARAFGPRIGWLGGWGIIVADIIVMANLAQIAGSYGFQFVGRDDLAENPLWTTIAGVLWIGLMTAICYVGIEVSAALQRWLLCAEVILLLLLSVKALLHAYGPNPPSASLHISASWFNPFAVSSASAFTNGILLAIFIYWGWDTAVSVNEETKDADKTPGRAAVISTVLLLAIYALVATSAQAYAGNGTTGIGLANPHHSGDVLSSLGNAVFGSHGAGAVLSKLLILSVLTSAAASTQTTILPTARTTLSMAVHRAIPQQFGRIHPRFLTPAWSTVGMGIASVCFYVGLTSVSENVLTDSIASVGLSIAFYYGLTGFACAWYFRRTLLHSARNFWLAGILPAVGGVILLFLFCYAAFYVYADPEYGTTVINLPLLGTTGGVSIIGVGALLMGCALMAVQKRVQGTWFHHPDVSVGPALGTPPASQ
ncbi:APC family permease [Streptomyces sp. NPDC047028]|uniref:APC family permease n=1 Tax=Streptomyces sp. NPDC047028 TaxID=3155793 RepID=UPI0033EADEC4